MGEKMTTEEAVKLIAEFDDVNWAENVSIKELLKFYLSLDNLVPTWKKIDNWDAELCIRWTNNEWQCDYNGFYTASDTLQVAVVIATAKAI